MKFAANDYEARVLMNAIQNFQAATRRINGLYLARVLIGTVTQCILKDEPESVPELDSDFSNAIAAAIALVRADARESLERGADKYVCDFALSSMDRLEELITKRGEH